MCDTAFYVKAAAGDVEEGCHGRIGLVIDDAGNAGIAADELITTAKNADGEVVPYVLNAANPQPKYVVILFPGGNGQMNPHLDKGRVVYGFGGNFLIRGREFLADEEFATVSTNTTYDEARVQALTTHCLELMQSKGLKTETPQAWSERAQIINVVVPEAGGLMDVLREKHGVITNVKDDRLRISMSFFNNEHDVEKVIGAIVKETGS